MEKKVLTPFISKNVLTEQALYFGDVSMPPGFEIDQTKLTNDILQSTLKDIKFPFSRPWDMLSSYVTEHINVKHNLNLVSKETWGTIYKPNEISIPLLNIDPVDLTNSPDFTLLYGVNVKECIVRIHYDDNRRKGRSWDIPLKDNMFVLFPSTNMYYISNNQKNSLNFIQTITYEYI